MKANKRWNKEWAKREPHEKILGIVAALSQDLDMDFFQWIMILVQISIFAEDELHGKRKRQFHKAMEILIKGLHP